MTMEENKNDSRARQPSISVPTRRSIVFLALAVAAVLYGGPAFAAQVVKLSGTHSKDEVNKACDGVSGIPVEGSGGDGYGCYNPKNGVLVACDNSEKCIGFIPSKAKMASATQIRDFLTLGRALAKGGGQPGETSPFSE